MRLDYFAIPGEEKSVAHAKCISVAFVNKQIHGEVKHFLMKLPEFTLVVVPNPVARMDVITRISLSGLGMNILSRIHGILLGSDVLIADADLKGLPRLRLLVLKSALKWYLPDCSRASAIDDWFQHESRTEICSMCYNNMGHRWYAKERKWKLMVVSKFVGSKSSVIEGGICDFVSRVRPHCRYCDCYLHRLQDALLDLDRKSVMGVAENNDSLAVARIVSWANSAAG